MKNVNKLQMKRKKAEEQKSSLFVPRISANCTLNKIKMKLNWEAPAG
jgi:hypothetical protein